MVIVREMLLVVCMLICFLQIIKVIFFFVPIERDNNYFYLSQMQKALFSLQGILFLMFSEKLICILQVPGSKTFSLCVLIAFSF